MAHRLLTAVWCLTAAALAVAQSPPGHVPVYIEDSPAAQELVEQAEALADQDRPTDAVAALQRVIDEYGGKLMPVGDGLFEEASRWVRGRIVRDAALLEVYRNVYGAEAERALNVALRSAGPVVDPAPFETVLARHGLTPAGLEAGLLLAGVYLERADAAAAASVLQAIADHPDMDAQAARFHGLATTAAVLLGDDATAGEHREALRALGAAETLAALDRLDASLHPPLRAQRQAGAPGAELESVVDALERPLWTVRLDEAPVERQRLPYAASHGETYPVLPVADADRLYVNDGDRVVALDRYSGRTLWEHALAPADDAPAVVVGPRIGRMAQDRRGVLVAGDRVYAVLGQVTTWPPRGEAKSGTVLVALDRATGELVWSIEPAALDASLERAYFQGTPIAAQDRVYVLLRRNQTTGFQDAFVAAVAAAGGEPLWRRHISSAVTASRYASTPPPTMTLRDGTLYVFDHLAAVAAVVGRTGSVRWARVMLDPGQTTVRGLATGGDTPTDVMPAVLTEAGLVVPPVSPGGPLLVLDPATGVERRRVEATGDRSVDYLLPTGRDVLAIGRSATLYDGRTLEPRWTAELTDSRSDGPRPKAAVTERLVVVATGGRLRLLDRRSGEVVREAPIDTAGNVLTLDGQLVVADSASVRSYLGWGVAYAALMEEAAAHPDDPAPGLAMAHLASTLRREAAVTEGIDLALAALDAAGTPDEATQRRVFQQVLSFAEDGERLGDQLRQTLFDRLATITAAPEQEVAYHLGLGELLEATGRAADAVEHYQAVLLDDTLAGQLHQREDVVRQASLEAQRRLERVVDAAGAAVYERFDLLAAARLRELTSGPVADSEALADLARRYPLARAAAEAMLVAGRERVNAGQPREAAALFRTAYRRAQDDPALLAEAVGSLAMLYEREDRPRQALHWLRRVSREHPALQPVRDGAPVAIDGWIAALRGIDAADRIGPSLALPLGQPRIIEGSLQLPAMQPPVGWPDRLVLVRDAGMLRMLAAPDFRPLWETPDPAEGAAVLGATEEQVLLWSAESGELFAFDAGSGEPAWAPVRADTLLEPLGDAERRQADQPEAQRRFMQMMDNQAPIVVRGNRVIIDRPEPPPGFALALGESVVCIADRIGGVAGVDRQTGKVLWRKAIGVERIVSAHAEGDTVALAGLSAAGTDAMAGAVQVLDLLTGEPRLPVLEDRDPPQWVHIVGEELLLVATAGDVTAHRLADGGVHWRVPVPGEPLTGQGWASPDLVVLGVNGDGVLVLDTETGETLNRLYRHAFAGPGPAEPRLVEDQWQFMTSARAMAMGPDGRLRWRDAIAGVGDHLVQQLVGERYVALLSVSPEQPLGLPGQPDVAEPDAEGRTSYRLYLLDRATGTIAEEAALAMPLGSIEPLRGMFVDNALLFAASDHVLVVPGAAPAE